MLKKNGWMKATLQVLVLLLVSWGIVVNVRKSAVQLASQREELESRAAALRESAQQIADTSERNHSLEQASALELTAKNFWRANPLGLLAAGVIYALGMLPGSLFWRQCLAALDQPTHLLTTMWAYFYGNLGKYFPGKAMVIILRVAALNRLGIKKTATSITIFMETLTMMSVGGAVAAVCLILLNLDWRLTLLSMGLLLATFIPTYPPILRYLIPRLQRGVEPQALSAWTARIHGKLFVRGWLLHSLTWLAFGLSLIVVLYSLPIANFENVGLAATLLSGLGACALAVVLGFASMIPGGAGVREAVLSTVLTPIVGPAAALCGAIWLRIVWLATELIVVGFLFLLRRFSPTYPAADLTNYPAADLTNVT